MISALYTEETSKPYTVRHQPLYPWVHNSAVIEFPSYPEISRNAPACSFLIKNIKHPRTPLRHSKLFPDHPIPLHPRILDKEPINHRSRVQPNKPVSIHTYTSPAHACMGTRDDGNFAVESERLERACSTTALDKERTHCSPLGDGCGRRCLAPMSVEQGLPGEHWALFFYFLFFFKESWLSISELSLGVMDRACIPGRWCVRERSATMMES